MKDILKKLYLNFIKERSLFFYIKFRKKIFLLSQKTKNNMIKISKLKVEKGSKYPIHLALGHEIISASAAFIKQNGDNFILSHRNMHFNLSLSDENSCEKIINESLVSKDSINKGNYGCMTMRNKSAGIIYTSSILANNISVGLGISSTNAKDSVTWIQTGDGAIEEGAFYESLVFAKARNLPIIIMIENNNWSLGSSIKERRKNINFLLLAKSIGLSYSLINKPKSIYQVCNTLRKARNSALFNPQIVEIKLVTEGAKQSKHRAYTSYHHGPLK